MGCSASKAQQSAPASPRANPAPASAKAGSPSSAKSLRRSRSDDLAEVPNLRPVVSASKYNELTASFKASAGKCPLEDAHQARFTQVEMLGTGAYGIVNRVINKESGREFADKKLKVPKKKNADGEEEEPLWFADLQSEVAIWETLRNPGVLELKENVQTERYVHLITEMMHGGELCDHLKRFQGPGGVELARSVAAQIASAIRFMHLECKVSHGDIKPANILCHDSTNLGHLGCIKLADFGSAQRFTTSGVPQFTRDGVGTLDYYAPELCECMIGRAKLAASGALDSADGADVAELPKYSEAVDIWAFGCSMYELFHGAPPFLSEETRKDDQKLVRCILTGSVSFPEQSFGAVPEEAKEFILRLVESDVQSRVAADELMQQSWIDVPEVRDMLSSA